MSWFAPAAAQAQFITEAIARGHDPLPHRIGESFKCRVNTFNTVAFIESARVPVQNIGPEVELLFRIGSVTGRQPDSFAAIVFQSCVRELFQDFPP